MTHSCSYPVYSRGNDVCAIIMANLVGVRLGSIPGLALKSMKHTQLSLRKEGCSEVEAEACLRDGKRATASE